MMIYFLLHVKFTVYPPQKKSKKFTAWNVSQQIAKKTATVVVDYLWVTMKAMKVIKVMPSLQLELSFTENSIHIPR